MAVTSALAEVGGELAGDLIFACGAGGMPTNAWSAGGRRNIGHGVGCSFLLEQGVWPDFAVVAKPGWCVSREEVGLCWFDISVSGTHTYVGSRHKIAYRNAIADAGELVRRLDQWFPLYSERHRDGEVLPQGIVSAIEGGWSRMAAVTPAICRIRVDMRISPRTSPADARRELEQALTAIGGEIGGIEWTLEQVLAIPAASTEADSWICRSAISAWEKVTLREHVAPTEMSGGTDANILRVRGIPTVRVGMAKVDTGTTPLDFQEGMNTVSLAAMAELTELLVRCAIDTCSRQLGEVAG